MLWPEDREKVVGAFRAAYLGEYGNLPNCDAYLHLLDESIHVTVVPEQVGQYLTSISGSYDQSNIRVYVG